VLDGSLCAGLQHRATGNLSNHSKGNFPGSSSQSFFSPYPLTTGNNKGLLQLPDWK